MATIVTQTADNAYHIQDAFRRLDRDDYPLGVYEAIYDYLDDRDALSDLDGFDVNAWCRDLRETTLDDIDDIDAFSDLDGFADYLRSATTVLYVDEDAEVIYHLAYYS